MMAGGLLGLDFTTLPQMRSLSLDDGANPNLGLAYPAPQAGAPAANGFGGIEGQFIGALRDGGLTNPNGLGAVAAYARHESRYDPSNVTGSWSDPSESGQPGTSGGILSWRGDRLANMRAFTAGASDPVAAQARFTLAENPDLTQALQNARSPEEANRLMADAWKFAGYDKPGGEYAARLASTRDYVGRLGGPTMQMPDSAGGPAAAAGFGLQGPQQGAGPDATMPASGAPMSVPDDDGQSGKPSFLSALSSLSGMDGKGKAPGQGQDGGDEGMKPFSFAPMKKRPFALMRFPSYLPARGGAGGSR